MIRRLNILSHKTFNRVLFLLSVVASLSFNLYNVSVIRKTNPNNVPLNARSLVNNTSVYSVDNEYYLSPPKNYINGKGWLRDPAVSCADAVRRVPGYSTLYLIGYMCFGEVGALWFLILIQTCLFGLFAICISNLIVLLNINFNFSRVVLLILFTLPVFYSFTFFTITEGVSFFLSGFFIYFLTKAFVLKDNKYLNYFLSSVLFTFIVLTRPVGAIGGLLFFLIFFENRKQIIRYIGVSATVPVLFISIWTFRNYLVTQGEFILLEKAYHPKSLDYFKIDLKGMNGLYKCWGAGSIEMSDNVLWFVNSVMEKNDTTNAPIERLYSQLPKNANKAFTKQEFFEAVKQHQRALIEKKAYHFKLSEMPAEYLPSQISAYEKYLALQQKYKSAFPFDYYFVSPIRYLKQMVFHSNSSHLVVFSLPKLGPLALLVKGALFVINILFFLALFSVLFIKKNVLIKVLCLVPLTAVAFFVFYFKEVEQTYMNPFLPYMLLLLFYFVNFIITKIKPE